MPNIIKTYDSDQGGPAGWGPIPTLGQLSTSVSSGATISVTAQAQAATSATQAAVAKDFLVAPSPMAKLVNEDGAPSQETHIFHTQITRKIGNFQTDPVSNTAASPNVATTPSALGSYGYTQAQADALIVLANNLAQRVSELETKLGLQA